jgi:hypothetical protein
MSYITGLSGTPGPGWFTDNLGHPKLWVAAETWALPNRAGEWNGSGGGTYQQDYDNFFSTRSGQGVTVLMTDVLAGTNSDAPNNNGSTWDGVAPFVSGGDPTTGLNSSFWTRVDYMMSSAESNGITIGFVFNQYDFPSGYAFSGWTSTQFQAYGTAVGNRYGSQPNIIWLFGNDEYPTSHDSSYESIITGLQGSGDTHLLGAWWSAEYTSRYETDNNQAASFGETYSAFNFGYTYNAGYWNTEYAYGEVVNQGQAHLLPVIWGDGYFYQGDATYFDTYDRAMRQETWWTLTAGARGFLSESENVWPWASTSPAAVSTNWFWVNNQANICNAYTGLGEWYNLLPDLNSALVTGGRGTRVSGLVSGGGGGQYEPAFTNSWVTASKTPDGKLAILYLPNSTTVTINQSLLTPGYTATWIDPVTGAKTAATPGSTYNSTAKGNNSQGDPDWVLVFQAPVTNSGPALYGFRS